MSLDVTLISEHPVTRKGTGIFVRRAGATVELSLEEAREQWPDRADEIQEHETETNEVYTANITHNLGEMARAVSEDFYRALWRPEELKATQAMDILKILRGGIQVMETRSRELKKLNPENGWGTFDQLLTFARNYENACREWPTAKIEVDR